MKLFYYAAAAAAMASAVFCSCDKQDEVTPPQPEIAPVQFVGVTALDVVTRAEAKPYAADFNVFIPGVTAATKLVKFNADAWTVDGDPILVDRTGGTLVAWAPSALAVTTSASGAEYTLTAQKDAAAQDLIYQPQPVNAANAGAVAVEMKHAYSQTLFPGNGRQWIHGCCQSYSGADYRWNLCDRHARYGSRHGGSGRHGDGGAYPGRRRKGACRAYGR